MIPVIMESAKGDHWTADGHLSGCNTTPFDFIADEEPRWLEPRWFKSIFSYHRIHQGDTARLRNRQMAPGVLAFSARQRHQVTQAYSSSFDWMRDAIEAAGITDLTCRPHGLRKTLGRLMADAECTAHEIMAALGHLTLAEAERYTRS